MRYKLPSAVLLLALFCSTAHAELTGTQIDQLASRLMLAESSGRWGAIGDGGNSRGLFQIHKDTWKLLTDRPFSDALDPEVNHFLALKLLHDINLRYGSKATTQKLAYTFNTGKFLKSNTLPAWTKRHPNKVYRSIFAEVANG